ncbi:FUSC family protein [Pinirhizobacter soli]|uniref:FUSC family protein n=1 Tax=Pinirhizobacter soli TaxID=2786953 RepID=UPI00202A9003|nr:FUSC family protein [Pinirhizobacter soli]
MTSVSESAFAEGLSALLRRELQLDAPRVRSILRIAAGTAIAVAITMVFQIPIPPYVAYLIFLLSMEDTASTLMFAVAGLTAATLAVALSVLFYVFDASEPALRIPLLALSTFMGTFLSRTSTLGPVAFLAGFVLMLSQTLIDDVPSAEAITHVVLWLWVVVATPVLTIVVLNLLTGESPVLLSRRRATALMEAVADYIELPSSQSPSLLREKLVSLIQLRGKAYIWDKKLKAFAEEDQRMFGLVLEILQIARNLPPQLSTTSRHALAFSVRQSRWLFLKRRGIDTAPVSPPQDSAEPASDPACQALHLALRDLHAQASGEVPAGTPSESPTHPSGFFVANAFHDPAHARYALKVTLAVMASYATYTLLDWPGIRTAVTTCFFVSLTTFGESAHKLTLRIAGAVLGGLIGGLCLVFVMPSLTDIGELCLLVAGVSALCAWVSTSSENISYAGMQMAFAFFLGVLQGYVPASDLTVLRDRVVGIVIGNLWISVFFTSLWPVSALQQARKLWSSSLERLSALLVAPTAQTATQLRLDVTTKARQAALLKSRSAFEGQWVPGSRPPDTADSEAAAMDRLTSSAFIVQRLQSEHPKPNADLEASQRLLWLSKGAPAEAMHPDAPSPTSLVDLARLHLNQEIDHASRLL